MSAGRSIFQLGFEISPVILTGGIATGILGGMLPIVSILQAVNFTEGILGGSGDLGLDQFFAHFKPVPGGTLADNDIGAYPFANQTVAANAIIANPLRVSLRMDCPAQGELGYVNKLAIMTALQNVLKQHIAAGGLFTVATPSFIYTNGILLNLTDISSGGDDIQVQTAWQWNFIFPLITLAQAEQAQNQLMTSITNGTPTDGSLSGNASVVGQQNTLASPITIPAASMAAGANAAQPALGGPNVITGAG